MRIRTLMMVTTLLAVAGGASAFSGAPQPIGVFFSGKCLDVEGGSRDDKAEIIQFDCLKQNNQRWTVQSVGNGMFRMVARHSGKCMDVSGASQDNGARVIQFACHDGTNQRFFLERSGANFKIKPVHASRKCLDIEGGGIQSGAHLIQFECKNQTNQLFEIN